MTQWLSDGIMILVYVAQYNSKTVDLRTHLHCYGTPASVCQLAQCKP